MGRRVLGAAAVAALLSIVLATHVYVDVDLVRVPLIASPAHAANGSAGGNTARRVRANELRAPFAVTARIRSASPGSFSIAADGVPICTRELSGGSSRRVDCAIVSNWDPAVDHEVVVRGPPADWIVDSLELSTHHGRNKPPLALVILPAGSDQYQRLAVVWVIVTWLLLTALVTLVRPPAMPRWLRIPYLIVAAAILLVLAAAQASQWFTS